MQSWSGRWMATTHRLTGASHHSTGGLCWGSRRIFFEEGVDIHLIQVALGHSKLDTTARYGHVASKVLREMVSPLDQLTSLIWGKDALT